MLLLGLISDSQTSRAWTPDASAILYEKYWKLHGGVEAISNRADGVGNSLLALGAQYGWQLAGMMLIGAALMRSGLAERAVQLTSLSSYWFCAGGDWGDH
ncbi:putative membrane protein YeiB [Escherichia coli]|uniref:Putative membrane protein YeiB n=1 Tax=Escherichia coli TaxID=562 RepID=A0A377B9Z5_ECOLX|nr:putative membrane protein YeiB [Escherichia coli]